MNFINTLTYLIFELKFISFTQIHDLQLPDFVVPFVANLPKTPNIDHFVVRLNSIYNIQKETRFTDFTCVFISICYIRLVSAPMIHSEIVLYDILHTEPLRRPDLRHKH